MSLNTGRPDRQRRPIRLLVSVAVLGLVLASCSVLISEDLGKGVVEQLPCDPPAQYVDLGIPQANRVPAEVTFSGAPVWASLMHETGGGGFTPVVDQAALWVGKADDPPIWKQGAGSIENADQRLRVHVGRYTEISLEPGRHWLVPSQGGNLELFTCELGAISDAVGVPDSVNQVPADIIDASD